MTSYRFQTIEEIFHRARALDPADRASFLDDACDGSLDLRAEVESLLAHADRSTSEVDLRGDGNGNGARVTVVDRGSLSEGPGTRIGPYKILQKIGEGGFGVVYMAEQQEPVQRKVALKIIKLGMDTKQVIARFEAERQALAMMDHPNIAKVLEAGATETGRPYFVMELVRGVPVTEYCDVNSLSLDDRLGLFTQICDAVHHAHQKGVIHRDLKPSNVLVTLHDTRPMPMVIDFGIAKATSRRLTERTLFTDFGQFIGTPEYMSPDQAEISGLDVDTRSDIYSLGVMLYELLTGTTPVDSITLRGATYGELQRIIREVEPPRPSTRVQTLVGMGSDVARHRRAEPMTLTRLIRGDLDWVVMKALEKDRTRRYQSASEFAADVHRFLQHQPVLAGPPSVMYRGRKFVQRHRLGVIAAGLIAAALVVGLLAATFGLVEARQEASRSKRIAEFLRDLLVSTNPEQALTENTDVQAILATARDLFGEDHATVAALLSSRALQLQSGGNLEAAEDLYEQSLASWREQSGGIDNVNVATTFSRMGLLLTTKGDNEGAEQALRNSLAILQDQDVPESLSACESMGVLAHVLINRGQYDEAEALLREMLRIRRTIAPQQRLQIAITINSLANVVLMAGRPEDTTVLLPEVIDSWRVALPTGGFFLGQVLTEIAVYYARTGSPDEAEPLLLEAIDIFEARPQRVTRYRGIAYEVLFELLRDRNAIAEAVPIAMRIVETVGPDGQGILPDNEDPVRSLGNLAWAMAMDDGLTEQEYRVGVEGIQLALERRPDSTAFINTLGVLQYRLGEDEAALATLARSHAVYSEQYETGVPADLAFMAMAHDRLGHRDEARRLLQQLRLAMEDPEHARSEENRRHQAEAEARLGHLLEESD